MWFLKLQLLILLSAGLLAIQAAPAEVADEVTHPPPEQLQTESRSRKDDVLDVEDDLDGRSAYVNNQFVPSEPVEVVDDEQNAPLYEILQKQMEQVLASTSPNDPIYEQREKQERRDQQQPPHQAPLFSGGNREDNDLQDDYDDEEDQTDQGYPDDPEKPDAVPASEEEDQPESGYQAPQLNKPISTTRRPNKRRTTSHPRTSRPKSSVSSRTTAAPLNQTSTTESPITSSTTTTHRPKTTTTSKPNSLPSDPQVYQHKRRIIFKTISTGSQFVNSPIGDLMIKFSIGFAKPTAPGAVPNPSNEALRALSNNILRNLELQKLKRANKLQKE
ncbi:submandibular gland secretory Glx-rich protein CA [Drosophila bipectinata]|uniref:submandibular gland secretory Glx-rich protein CA n=1 Tax=Drosophila bipectinata TaxID=42026 RepID=UPI001C8AA12F|nr:uncharacterized protein LOC108127750 [Drosophila bipectinata]